MWKEKKKKGFSQRDLQEWTLPESVNYNDTHRKPTIFLRELYQQKHWLKGTEAVQNEKRPFGPHNLTDRTKAEKTTLPKILPFIQREGWLRGTSKSPESRAKSHGEWFSGLETQSKEFRHLFVQISELLETSDSCVVSLPPCLLDQEGLYQLIYIHPTTVLCVLGQIICLFSLTRLQRNCPGEAILKGLLLRCGIQTWIWAR